jgi:hypothetical protein
MENNYIDIESYIMEDVLDNYEYMGEDDLANEVNNLIDDLNNHPESLEEILGHFEEMYTNFSHRDSINIARFALQNIIEIRSEKIMQDYCNG